MSTASSTTIPLRPVLVDYYLILLGCSLSLFLMRLGGAHGLGSQLHMEAREGLALPVRELVGHLFDIMRLNEGIVLLWPVFLALQSVRGRSEGLTAGEWLWVIAWLCVLLLTGLAAWEKWAVLPDWLKEHASKPRSLYYMIVTPAMGGLALLFALFGLVQRGPTPWTHAFSLALVSWPVLPLAGIVTLTK